MKMRLAKKELKKEAKVIINKMDPTLKISFLNTKKMLSAAGYLAKSRTIYLNVKELRSFYVFFKEAVNISFPDFLTTIIAHEFGHSAHPEQKEYYSELKNIFKNYASLSIIEKIEKEIEYKTKNLGEEKRAWEVAKKYLDHIPKKQLEYVINISLYTYINDLDQEKKILDLVKSGKYDEIIEDIIS